MRSIAQLSQILLHNQIIFTGFLWKEVFPTLDISGAAIYPIGHTYNFIGYLGLKIAEGCRKTACRSCKGGIFWHMVFLWDTKILFNPSQGFFFTLQSKFQCCSLWQWWTFHPTSHTTSFELIKLWWQKCLYKSSLSVAVWVDLLKYESYHFTTVPGFINNMYTGQKGRNGPTCGICWRTIAL